MIVLHGAEQDLAAIFRYSIENWGIERAIAYRDLLFEIIRSLPATPAKGSPVRDAPQLRSIKAGQHRVYYRFDDAEVTIMRVLHHAMGAPRHLS